MKTLTCHQTDDFHATCTHIESLHAWHFKIEGAVSKEVSDITNQWILEHLDKEEISFKKPINLIVDIRDVSSVGIKVAGLNSARQLFSDKRFYWFALVEPQSSLLAIPARMFSMIITSKMRFRNFRNYDAAFDFLQSADNPFYGIE